MQAAFRKLKFKGPATVINAPPELHRELIGLGAKTDFDKQLKSDNTLVFVNNAREFVDFLKSKLKNVQPDSVLWFSYPKLSSGRKTDINRDTLRVTGEGFGITAVAAISIDDTWSALRFRPVEKVGK